MKYSKKPHPPHGWHGGKVWAQTRSRGKTRRLRSVISKKKANLLSGGLKNVVGSAKRKRKTRRRTRK